MRKLLIAVFIVCLAAGCKTGGGEALTPPAGANVYKLGNVIVDTRGGEIRFAGRVRKDEGRVQFLLYAHGYKWLEEESAIVADARLADIQKAIALLDWKLWDDLWFRRKMENEPSLLIEWKGRRVEARELTMAEDPLGIGDLIFLGSPYFDPIVLQESALVDCSQCPYLRLEQEVLREEFERESGKSGYELNPARMPPEGADVTIILQIPPPNPLNR
ncbi:MAG TPA: hypothetical protein EYP09_07610 [Anaerolineae bacterium]|nr:hypothetical protein [Anaerolineae bacterium]